MAEKRVKIGKEFEHIPAVKSGRGWLGLERGKFAAVYFVKRLNKLELRRKVANGKEGKRFFDVEEYAKANEAARKAKKNAVGKIEKNVFRHTAVSCLAVLHGFQQAADYCGHSLRTQGANYRNLVSKQDAKDYFNIIPPTGDGKVIPFDRSRGEALAVGKDGARQNNAILKIDVANA
ncbi:MAG: hypothetical protein IJN19_03895 [Opitutales bacterium]|nr:hypothetical protein [Opitutales bacterium]